MAGCSDSATSWRLFDSNISCRAVASDFALWILGENVHGVHAVLYLGDRAECILEADEMGSKAPSLPVDVARGLVQQRTSNLIDKRCFTCSKTIFFDL